MRALRRTVLLYLPLQFSSLHTAVRPPLCLPLLVAMGTVPNSATPRLQVPTSLTHGQSRPKCPSKPSRFRSSRIGRATVQARAGARVQASLSARSLARAARAGPDDEVRNVPQLGGGPAGPAGPARGLPWSSRLEAVESLVGAPLRRPKIQMCFQYNLVPLRSTGLRLQVAALGQACCRAASSLWMRLPALGGALWVALGSSDAHRLSQSLATG